jgi:hypothetical protein
MKRILLILTVFSFTVSDLTWGAGNQISKTLTINTGMGVNNGTNKNLSTSDNAGTACAGGNAGSCDGGPFADTSDPFNINDDCSPSSFGDFCSSQFDPDLPGGFNLIDNRFGRGAPCGPNDVSGPPFPYPCQGKGSIYQTIPLGIDDPNSPTVLLTPPSLGGVGQPFYQFRSDTFGTLRVHHIEYGFDLDMDGQQTLNTFYIIDSVTDANGQMVGNAVGTFRINLSDAGMGGDGPNCSVTSSDVSSEGRFESGPSGVITCVDRAGNLCQGSQFDPGKFSRTSFTCPP